MSWWRTGRSAGTPEIATADPAPDPEIAGPLGDALRAAGYTHEAVAAALGVADVSELRRSDVPVYERRLEAEPLRTLAKLFLLHRRIAADALEAALTEVPVSRLLDASLLVREGRELLANAMIAPFDGLFVASDPWQELPAGDHVPGIGPASVTAAALAIRRPVDAALDVGTGCGVLALLAARHSKRVVATDVSSRALTFARLSAGLSAVDEVDWRQGGLYHPVEGERFGFVVCNAPFVISPDSRFVFRDSGRAGSELSAELVRETPKVLEDGGFAQLNVSWTLEAGQNWVEPLRDWVTGSGCDAWLLRYNAVDPLTHAATWNRPVDAADPHRFGETLDRWTAYFEREGISEIAIGTVYLRRRTTGKAWVRADELPRGPYGPASDQVLRVFENQDVLEASGEDAVRRVPLRFDAAHSLRRTEMAGPGGWTTQGARLYLREGLRFRLEVGEQTLALLTRLDGDTLLDELDPGHPVDQVRRLLELGFLTFAGAVGKIGGRRNV